MLDRADQPDRWYIARKYGFLSAGGGSRYWKPLRHLTPGNRVFAYVGGAGYVGIGRVTGEMTPARVMPKLRSTDKANHSSVNQS